MAKKIKYIVYIEVFEDNGRPNVAVSTEENNATLQEIGLAVYTLEQIKLGLVDREWDGEGYSVEGDGFGK